MQVPSTEEIRSLLSQQVLLDQTTGRTGRHPVAMNDHQIPSDEALMNTSLLSCISESGYEGDQEDEGDTAYDDMDEMEEFDEEGIFNRPARNSSFLGDDEFSRSGSTPSILRPELDDKNFYDVDVDEVMETEPICVDDVIDSASGYHIPVVLQPCVGPSENYRAPLRAIENAPNHMHTQGFSVKRCQGNMVSGSWLVRGMPRGDH